MLRLFQLVVGIASIAIMARLLGPEAYGVFGLAMVVVGFGQLVTGAWGGSYIAKAEPDGRAYDALAWITIAASLLAAGGVFAASIPLAGVTGFARAAELLPALSLIFLLGAPVVFLGAEVQRQGRYDLMAQSETAATGIAVAVGITLAALGYGVWSFVGMELLRAGTRLAILAVRVGVWPGLRCRAEDFRAVAGFDGTRLGGRMLQWADQAVPRILIARLLGEEALGIFVLGWRVYTQLKEVAVGPFAMFAMPSIAAAKGNRAEIHAMLDTWQRLSACAAFPMVVGFVLICPLLVGIWLDERWAGSVLVMQLLVLSALRSASAAFNGAVLEGMGRPGLQFITYACGLAATLVLVPAGIGLAGLAGASGAVLLRSLITWPIGAALVERVSSYASWRQLSTAAPAAASSAIMAVVVVAVLIGLGGRAPDWIVLLSAIAAGAAGYLIAARFIHRRSLELVIGLIRGVPAHRLPEMTGAGS